MGDKMGLVCRMQRFSAMEYMEFLRRYGIECFGVSIVYGENVAIYADEEKYLQLSIEDDKFNQNEKQLVELLTLLENAIEEYTKLAGQTKQASEPNDENDEENNI